MPKGTNQKLKLYRLSQIMIEKTDETHYLSMEQILEELAKYDITADRKSIYDDLRALEVLGINVEGERDGRIFVYHVVSKPFEIAEVKLLVDAIQSSKFVTEKKSRQLIRKLMNNVSKFEAEQLNRQVVVSGRIKTMNESIYYNVDEIHHAITQNRSIQFQYLKWNLEKKLVPRRESLYEVSPWALTWDDENYYLIGFDHRDQKIKHYRVDKMKNISVTEEERCGRERFSDLDMASYTERNFSMFSGDETKVKLRFRDELVGVMIDRFGNEISVKPSGIPGWSETLVKVAVSKQFLGWVFSLGNGVRIESPESVRKQFLDEMMSVRELYV